MSDDKPRRMQSATERDMAGIAARKERAKSPAVEFVCEDVTGQYEGEELIAARERRAAENPAARIALVETRLSGVEVGLARVEGKLDILPELVGLLKGGQRTERLRLSTRARVVIAIVGAISAGITAAIAALSGCS